MTLNAEVTESSEFGGFHFVEKHADAEEIGTLPLKPSKCYSVGRLPLRPSRCYDVEVGNLPLKPSRCYEKSNSGQE